MPRCTTTLKFAALLAVMASPVIVASATAPEGPYAVIAYSTSTGKHGWFRSFTSNDEAEKGALARCGAADARLVCWAHGGYYCALAVDSSNPAVYGTGYASTPARAKAGALQKCRQASRNPDRCRVAVCVYTGAPAARRNNGNHCIRCGCSILPFSSYCRRCDVRR